MPLATDNEQEWLEGLARLLDDPAHAANPLRPELQRLLEHNTAQRERLARLVRISDNYHAVGRQQTQSLSDQYDKQLRRLEKLARISDRYQNTLRELSEALKDAALHDPLTGLGNRRFLMDRLKEETERAARKNAPYGLAILDVDKFKSINDQFGHDAGDKALCAISRVIQDSLREYDICGRWGGEEFLILLPETPLEFAYQAIERLRHNIAQLEIPLGELGCARFSASFGLTMYRADENFSVTINRADTLLLEAKNGGRNRVVVG